MHLPIKFNNNNLSFNFPINPENPFFKITKIIVPKIKKGGDNIDVLMGVSLSCLKKNATGNTSSSLFNGHGLLSSPSLKEGIFNFEQIINDSNDFHTLELIYENKRIENFEIEVHYETVNNNVSLVNPFENFKRHIEQKDNVKILFSAPFGQGKTTFLNYFFEQHTEEYEVFKVFPVNYSISHNEDVFKYIKAELLFQLLGKNVDFDKESFSYYQTAPQFFKNNSVRVLAPLIKLIPKIGKSAYEIFEPLYKLACEYFEHHDKSKINDNEKAEKFIGDLYEKEGSIFEDNFYTQLIRQLLERLKISSKKRNILIIEDLDRMDPDHIFRILNVFAAHFDSNEYDYGYSNKFGFDKIIIVGDYNNIKNTFAYRYGPIVDFNGYINKYYSKEPFYYNNRKAISYLIENKRKEIDQSSFFIGVQIIHYVLLDLALSENITLRELIKLLKVDIFQIALGNTQRSQKREKDYYHLLVHYNLIYYLTRIFDIDSVIQKFENCKNRVESNSNINYHYFTSLGLPTLVIKDGRDDRCEYLFNSNRYRFVAHRKDLFNIRWEYYDVAELVKVDQDNKEESANFNRTDLYEMLILNAKKYKEVGGFD